MTYELDPDDLIFPRTASRIGPKFQVNVPPGPEPYNIPIGKYYPKLSELWTKIGIQTSRREGVIVLLKFLGSTIPSPSRNVSFSLPPFQLPSMIVDYVIHLMWPKLVAEGEIAFHESYGFANNRNS